MMTAEEKQVIIEDLAIKVSEKNKAELDQIKSFMEGLKNEELKALLAKNLVENDSFENLKDIVTEVKNELKDVQDMNTNKLNKSFKEQISEQLKAQANALKELVGNQNGKDVVLSLKAPATQTTGNITLPSATPASYTYQDMDSVIPAPDLIPFVQNYTDNGQTDRPSLAYVDEVGQEGDAAFIGEGVVKPLFDVDYEIRYSEAKKVAGKVKVSMEALNDIPFMASEIDRKLRQRHDIVKQDGILNGDGIGANLKGIVTRASAFAAGGLATSIDEAQNYDVIVATYNQILTTSDGNYIPNAVFVNPTDATLMKLTKDTDGNYIMPPFVSEDGEVVNNVRVVQNTKIPLGYFLMGDFTKAHVREYEPFSVRIGYTGDDFEKNLVTLLGESRLHLWISSNEEAAFVYDQFSVAKTALETV